MHHHSADGNRDRLSAVIGLAYDRKRDVGGPTDTDQSVAALALHPVRRAEDGVLTRRSRPWALRRQPPRVTALTFLS